MAAQDLIVASYSVATNNLGITQPAPMAAQATTMVQSPPPVIIREQPLFASTKKRGLIGFSLTFKSALSSATANNAGNYQLDTVTTKKVKRKVVTILKRIGFRVSYDAAHETVDITMTGKQTFPHGGRLTVESGVTGVPVAGTTVFAISKAGRLDHARVRPDRNSTTKSTCTFISRRKHRWPGNGEFYGVIAPVVLISSIWRSGWRRPISIP